MMCVNDMFSVDTFGAGHNATNQDKWIEAKRPYKVFNDF